MARGMIDIYQFDEKNECGFNFNNSIEYIKNLYINNNSNNNTIITNNNNTSSLTSSSNFFFNSINALLGTFFQKKCNFSIPNNRIKGKKSLTIKNWLVHIK